MCCGGTCEPVFGRNYTIRVSETKHTCRTQTSQQWDFHVTNFCGGYPEFYVCIFKDRTSDPSESDQGAAVGGCDPTQAGSSQYKDPPTDEWWTDYYFERSMRIDATTNVGVGSWEYDPQNADEFGGYIYTKLTATDLRMGYWAKYEKDYDDLENGDCLNYVKIYIEPDGWCN